MKINNYFYVAGAVPKEDRIELLEDRTKYFTQQYLKMFKTELQELQLPGKVAFLYASGASLHQGESRNYKGSMKNSLEIEPSAMVIKELTAYMMHKYITALIDKNNITYANINSNTCASSMHSIYEAETLLEAGVVDHVIIISEERTSFNTIRIFKEHQIDVTPGEGFACVVLSNEDGVGATITDTKWEYTYNRNPFYVSAEGYKKVASAADNVKGHGTGTDQNTEAEKVLSDDIKEFKSKIGHTQGASALIELCMVLDDIHFKGSTLCTASGLGGFYGSCVLHK